MFARQQMIEFLKTLPRGQRVALFTLGYDLRMIAGFTTSTDELIAAANKLRPGVSPCLIQKRTWKWKTMSPASFTMGGLHPAGIRADL